MPWLAERSREGTYLLSQVVQSITRRYTDNANQNYRFWRLPLPNFVEILSVVPETKYSTVQEGYSLRPSICNLVSTPNRWTDFNLVRVLSLEVYGKFQFSVKSGKITCIIHGGQHACLCVSRTKLSNNSSERTAFGKKRKRDLYVQNTSSISLNAFWCIWTKRTILSLWLSHNSRTVGLILINYYTLDPCTDLS